MVSGLGALGFGVSGLCRVFLNLEFRGQGLRVNIGFMLI